ncbi:ATP-dependent RNA helicase, partial [Pseudomonadota bacterium]
QEEGLEFFTQLMDNYQQEHNIPALEIAAALAKMVQGDEPLLLKDKPAPVRRERSERGDDSRRDRKPRDRDNRGENKGRRAMSSTPEEGSIPPGSGPRA